MPESLEIHEKAVAEPDAKKVCKSAEHQQDKNGASNDVKIEMATVRNAILRFAKLTEHAIAPTRGSRNAAGYDLYSAYEVTVPSKGRALAKTDIQIAVPDGCYGRVAPRSGLAVKHGIDVGAGVIDHDYRGNVGVVLFNFGDEDFKVSRGDRVAQLVLEKIYYPDLEECQSLDETERGSAGFGSTGGVSNNTK